MKFSKNLIFFLLISLCFNIRANEIFNNCGISMQKPKSVIINIAKDKLKECKLTIQFSTKYSPAILEDENGIRISNITIEDALNRSEYFEKIDSLYQLRLSHKINEPQYQLNTIDTQVKIVVQGNRKSLLGMETVRVTASPFWLWPSSFERKAAIQKYIGEKGLFFTCFYGQSGIQGKEPTATITGCIPRSKSMSDLSIDDFERMFMSIRFLE